VAAWPFTHVLDVRYGECDQQGIVFNAHYLAFVDDAMDHWMRSLAPSGSAEHLASVDARSEIAATWVDSWDVMLKSASLTWHGPARWTEQLAIDCGVARWGSTSFEVGFRLRVGDRPVCDARVTYVSVTPGALTPMVTPAEVVEAMGPVVEIPDVAAGG
jgi:acyl-CoA thioester hydrolase